ncbi:interleukin 12 receptor, beta 2a, like [Parambassis ranga]|uniref:Interleukin-12 receptor subunit beta-2-like n=1 Tax=Parambassis ranga TaxID=210632 RepID=A0A6P7IKN9_9TELE|nr:interleukin-12 receptor subunit beta-2-like [Parambassis ranga]XP_028268761.1 interleukin-12 receptor subunit beta-2-like [Parambassis ranga]
MDTPWLRWHLSILLITLTKCWATGGPPVPPSHLECYRPYDEDHRWVDIHCVWDQKSNHSTNYSLHWEPANSEDGHGSSGSSLDGIIGRKHFSNGVLHVWVLARNQHGSAKSEVLVFNTEDIIKPPPPKFSTIHHDPLEVYWTPPCRELEVSSGVCDLQYRTQEDQVWGERESGLHGSYIIENPKPYTVYEIQVRCTCLKGLTSDWSEIYEIKSAEAAPVGVVDVWRDCDMYPTDFDCFLTWKNLSFSEACGFIWAFEVKLCHNDGTVKLLNVTTTEPSGQIVYDGLKWYLNSSLKGVSSVNVSAYNTRGATVPYRLVLTTGNEENNKNIQLNMTEETLTVSWTLPQHLTDNVKEYVVQYKEVGSAPGRGFDWIKVNKSQKTGGFKGQFKKYTPYRVSVFTVSNSSEVYQFSSKIAYSLEKAPSSVPFFEVSSISATDVTLFWEPVPLSKQNGLILYYEIRVDTHKVYNVPATPQQEKMTCELKNLEPGRGYEVWIRAVNGAGPGANVTRTFHTEKHENIEILIVGVLGVGFVVLVIFCGCLRSNFCGESKVRRLMPQCLYEKVPDPGNSYIFRQMKHQFNEPLVWNCIPVYEPHTKISVLEVVEIKSLDDDPDKSVWSVAGDRRMDCQEDQRDKAIIDECLPTDHRFGREDYSKMVDSDEENSTSSSEEEPFTSGYEKHFMPTAVEVLNV